MFSVKKLLSFVTCLVVASVLLVTTPITAHAESYTTVTYYYCTTDPNAQPIVINGITYYPCNTMPGNAQQVNTVPANQCQFTSPCQSVGYVPSGQNYYNPCQTANSYYNGAVVPKMDGVNLATVHDNSGINDEVAKQTGDLEKYATNRGWNVEVKNTSDSDCQVKRTIKFSNNVGYITIEQITSLISAGRYSTSWYWKGSTTSKDAIKQALDNYRT